MRNVWVAVCGLILWAWCAAPTCAAEPKPDPKEEAEKKQAQTEQEADRDNLNSGTQTTYAGRIDLDPIEEDKPLPKTFGNFTVAKGGSTYAVKLSDPHLYKVLSPYNGKTVAVLAKLRNDGKYLVITGLVTAENTPKGVGKRGGF